MFESVTSGEGFTQEQRICGYYGYAFGSMENAFGYAIDGMAELFSMWALNEVDTNGSTETAGQLWNRFVSNPAVQDYINKVVLYGRIRGMA